MNPDVAFGLILFGPFLFLCSILMLCVKGQP